MTRRRTHCRIHFGPRVTLALLAAVLSLSAFAHADEGVLIPVAPPEDHELEYNIPLEPWFVPAVHDLKTEFADSLTAEFALVSETRTTADLVTMVEAGRELAVSADRVRETLNAIGELDVTYGIEDIARILPAESALRDTLFGYVVWHEFSSAPARGMMTRFEDLANRVTGGGATAGELAESMALMQERLETAIDEGDMATIAELTPEVVQVSGRIDAVCGAVGVGAIELGALVDSLGADSGELLFERWEEASAAISAVPVPCERAGPANEALSDVLHLVIEFGELVGDAYVSAEALEAPPDDDGNVYIPWTAMRKDFELASELEYRILQRGVSEHAQRGGDEADGEEGDHEGHDHAAPGYEYFGAAATEETKEHIAALLPLQVQANALLTEKAVEYTSARVWYTIDMLEQSAMDRERYSRDMSDRDKRRVFEKVDKRLRENMELTACKRSMSAARAWLESARAFDARGAGYEADALYHYQNAWLHCLNAGASAQRSLGYED